MGATNKFTVDSATGDTVIAGSLTAGSFSNLALSSAGVVDIAITSTDNSAGFSLTSGNSANKKTEIKFDDGTFKVVIDSTTRFAIPRSTGKVSVMQLSRVATTVDSGTADASALTGAITSSSSNMASGATETVTVSNTNVNTNSVIVASVRNPCTGGVVVVTGTTPASDEFTLTTHNVGSSACSSSYTVSFVVLN